MAQTKERGVNVALRGSLSPRHIPDDTVIGHTDGSWHEENQIAGLGWTFHHSEASNANTTLLDKGSQAEQFVNSPLMAEALAMRLAIKKAMERGISRIIMHSDSLVLINAIASPHPIKGISGILQDIKAYVPLFPLIEFRHVLRTNNVLVDSLAKRTVKTMYDETL
ncbi:unnamed protein product [Arabis nemorensis]|uniref:RNase H type-1 domain-containing protein n=1 Tax=Arabis nemorensis TaxID=586526 RepID=A0A565B844_9BRAS|nr:unnamed protein product [Arabis nemorensis]